MSRHPATRSSKPARPFGEEVKAPETEYFHVPPLPAFQSLNHLFHDSDSWLNPHGRRAGGDDRNACSRADLDQRSSRKYIERISDIQDFASTWEKDIARVLRKKLPEFYDGDFSVDVHNFPEFSDESVPRVIYITSSVAASAADERRIRDLVQGAAGPRFKTTPVMFRQGHLERCGRTVPDRESCVQTVPDRDIPCPPKNTTFRSTPVIGMSIGPIDPQSNGDAASLGGIVYLNRSDCMCAMSASHVFSPLAALASIEVSHPAIYDYCENLFQDAAARRYDLGTVLDFSLPDETRRSLTFDGVNARDRGTHVEMDWSLIKLSIEGRNVVTVPSFAVGGLVTVQSMAPVQGNAEVYAMARTSGYSLGFVSDVPGLQRFKGVWHGEWSVRQYNPSAFGRAASGDLRWQKLKHWISSGIGVAGDSGAWLIRRDNNAVIGLVWARNYTAGERVRETYFTPMVDVMADIREKRNEEISLPVISPEGAATTAGAADAVQLQGERAEPWNTWSSESLDRRRQETLTKIENDFVLGEFAEPSTLGSGHPPQISMDDRIAPEASHFATSETAGGTSLRVEERLSAPSRSSNLEDFSEADLERLLQDDKAVSELSAPSMVSASTSSTAMLADRPSDASLHVRVVSDDDPESTVPDDEAPIRSKASSPLSYPELLKVIQARQTPQSRPSWCSWT